MSFSWYDIDQLAVLDTTQEYNIRTVKLIEAFILDLIVSMINILNKQKYLELKCQDWRQQFNNFLQLAGFAKPNLSLVSSLYVDMISDR